MFKTIEKLPSVKLIKNMLPLDKDLKKAKAKFDKEIQKNMLTGKRLVTVVGPCSADSVEAVSEYVTMLKQQADLHKKLLVVARIYTAKPHSDGSGYQGLVFDGETIAEGILNCRKLMINCIKAGLPVADELLYTELYPYFDDLVSYWFVGARSSEEVMHRAFASSLNMPVGIKNATKGNIQTAVRSLYAVQHSCVVPCNGKLLQSDGNQLSHIVLRGFQTDDGYFNCITDDDIANVKQLMNELGVTGYIMADLSHANSGKLPEKQLDNAKLVSENKLIGAVMAESYIVGGAGEQYGQSKTDDCLSFEQTVTLLQVLEKGFKKRK